MDTRTAAKTTPAAAPEPSWSHRHRGALIAGSVLAALVLAFGLFLLLFNWDWLRGPIGRYASARTGRVVRIEGHLRVHPFSWTPSAEVQGLRIGNPSWVASETGAAGQLAYVSEFDLSLKLMPLFIGRVELPLVRLVQPQLDLIRDAQGRANWSFGSQTASKPLKLPPIQRFFIRQGSLSMKDAKRDLTLTGTINAAEKANGSGRGFELIGQGVMNKEMFKVEATGGPLIHVEASKPYPFHLDVHAGATHVAADGRLPKPFNLGELDADVQASGPNLADLYPLIGIALPGTPAYSLQTHLQRQDSKFILAAITGRVGESDLEGSMTVDKLNDRRTVDANLASRKLVFSDLLAVTGGGPKVKTPAAATPVTPAGRLLPDARLYRDRLQTMDAKLRYSAASVVTQRWPLRKVSLDLTLDHGLLTLNPLEFEFPQGRLTGKVRLDARKDPVVSDLDMRLTGLGLQQMLPPKNGEAPAIEGVMQARAMLHGQGDTIHEAASTAGGRVVIVVPHGKIRQAFAELMGINVANGLYLLLSKSDKETDLRCAVADFNVRNGVMSVNDAVFDTGVVRAQGKGTIDLKNEQLDLRLDGQTKKPRILTLWAPITLKGTLLHPRAGVDAGKAAGQLGIAAAIGAVLSPLAAILPFIEPGLAKDANCAGLIQEAKAAGAPVKAVPPPAPAKH